MSDEKLKPDEQLLADEQLSPTVQAIYEQTDGPKPEKKRNKKVIIGAIALIMNRVIK